ncbi:sigma-E processing peptidase SpoIIGA [Serpentinicella alkaliphila]|uniref:Sporulation sigma-E factor-processing peptidase n=1 Tax=Serpentinicella alkaliphila TaxID=1734049 RepID=A0A4R2TNV7_9FIRM|nr:sigma-E processing peptidase SpoIIGA [Serpentinicella alkaliphila]QUH26075.1 sigma-E processing peptidase SpoIIGA [Serpentinicella alkaliphila]TCP99088.1 stage II sporulation protein GA (sporulation sigma-E factor processing peptidase) [Serpentinicella alkaliphila]
MIVYAEYVFLENFIMNYIILHLTSKFTKRETSKRKLCLAAAISALYAFVIFFPSLHFLFSMIMKFACSMLIIVIAYTPYKFKDFFRLLGTFYLITLIFGGAGFAMFYFTSFNGIISNGIFYTTDVSLKNIFIACGGAYILINFSWGYIQRQMSKDKVFLKVKIQIHDEIVECIGLVDTGNALKDPLTNYPVIIVEYGTLKCLLPAEISNVFSHAKSPNLDQLSNIYSNLDWVKRIRMIPYKALGTENGMLVGIKPDLVLIENDKDVKNVTNIIIAIYNNELSKEGEYRALLHPDLL